MATNTWKLLSLICVCTIGFLRSLSLGHELPGPTYRLADSADKESTFVKETLVEDGSYSSQTLSRKRRQAGIPVSPPIIEEKTHKYYNSSYFNSAGNLYIEMDGELEYTVKTHKALSESHLTAGKVDLPFEFTFYGHSVKTIYLATGGFIYLGPYFHDFLTATQYIAPLMGNFDPSVNDTSTIRYANNGTAFTVEWSQVHVSHRLKDNTKDVNITRSKNGSFTFQTTLMKDGRIIFAYKKVPLSANDIGGGNGHKVTVGLSDGFYIDEPVTKGSSTIKRTIYRYHTVDLNKTQVVDNSAFLLTPLLTCNRYTNCNSCISAAPVINFECSWCSAIKRCSSGFDRHRQDWLEANCLTESIQQNQSCPGPSSDAAKQNSGKVVSPSAGAIIAVVVVVIVLALWIGIAWLVYAYRHPTSNSGLFLIELRHYFKKDSTTTTNNEDRYAVTISGDIQSVGTNGDAVEVAPEKTPTAPPVDTGTSEA